MIRSLFLILMCICSYSDAHPYTDLSNNQLLNKLYSLSASDQKEIKLLFEELFKNEVFSYSLFDNKTLSLSREPLCDNSSDELLQFGGIEAYCRALLSVYGEPCHLFNERWEIWEKNKSLFPIKKYVFLKKQLSKNPYILLINKEAFIEIVNKNMDVFCKLIKKDITAKGLLDQFENDEKSVFEILNYNEGLLGILLGFGTHNSMLFQKRDALNDLLGKGVYDPKQVQKKIKELDHKLQFLREHDHFIISSIDRVGFVADQEHPETIRLRQHYDNLICPLKAIYERYDWFEQTLLKLTSD